MKLHWYHDVSTYNGQPFSSDAETLCGKKRTEDVNGDELTRTGASHPYQVTCPECKVRMDKLAARPADIEALRSRHSAQE